LLPIEWEGLQEEEEVEGRRGYPCAAHFSCVRPTFRMDDTSLGVVSNSLKIRTPAHFKKDAASLKGAPVGKSPHPPMRQASSCGEGNGARWLLRNPRREVRERRVGKCMGKWECGGFAARTCAQAMTAVLAVTREPSAWMEALAAKRSVGCKEAGSARRSLVSAALCRRTFRTMGVGGGEFGGY